MFAKLSFFTTAFTFAILLAAMVGMAAPTADANSWGSHHGDDSWYDNNVAWSGQCPQNGNDEQVFYGKEILWTDFANNGHLACGRRHPDDKFNQGYFVAVDAAYGDAKCGSIVKLNHGNQPTRCGVVIETGAPNNGLLLSPAFFSQYNDVNQGTFHGDWNFVNTW